MLLWKSNQFVIQEFSKIPLNKTEVSRFLKKIEEGENKLHIGNVLFEVGKSLLPLSEHFPQILELGSDKFSCIRVLKGGIPSQLNLVCKIFMLQPIVLKSKNGSFRISFGNGDQTWDMI